MIGDPYIESGMSDLEYCEQVCGHWPEEEEPECPCHQCTRSTWPSPRPGSPDFIGPLRSVDQLVAWLKEDLPEDQCPF